MASFLLIFAIGSHKTKTLINIKSLNLKMYSTKYIFKIQEESFNSSNVPDIFGRIVKF